MLVIKIQKQTLLQTLKKIIIAENIVLESFAEQKQLIKTAYKNRLTFFKEYVLILCSINVFIQLLYMSQWHWCTGGFTRTTGKLFMIHIKPQ